MAVLSLDNEFMQYWSRLTVVEKESLLNVARNYVQLKESPASIEAYNNEINKAVARIEKGDFYTQDDVEKLSNNW